MPQATREVTDIEENVLESVGRTICHELRIISEPLGTQPEYEGRQPSSQMLRVMPPEEKTLTLTFDVTMNDSKGMLNIAFPSVISSALMRKLRAELVYQRARVPAVNQESISQRLLQSPVRLELATPAIAASLMELLAIRRGEILPLRLSIETPAVLRMRGRGCWSARAVSSRNLRAAQLEQRLAGAAADREARSE
jgi:flagellar motor switch protein FliM